MKKLMLFLALVLVSSLSFAQTIQYKDKESDTEWKTIDKDQLTPKCLTGKEALKLSGDFSKFTVKWKNSDGKEEEYQAGPVIGVCCNTSSYTYPDEIIERIKDPENSDENNEELKYVDMSGVTDINSMQYIFSHCSILETIVFPSKEIATARNFEFAFNGCKALQNADLSMFKNIANIDRTFVNCHNMTEVKFCPKPENLDMAIYGTFEGCIRLKGIDLSMYKIKNVNTGVTQIPFQDCYSLDYVYLPQGYVEYLKESSQPTEENIFGENYNPNCLKILSKDDTNPDGIMDGWTNVVYGNTAFTDINLKEGFIQDIREKKGTCYNYTYQCPEEIQLGNKKATFTPKMSVDCSSSWQYQYQYQWANGESGWNTIVLPFTGALQMKHKTDAEYKSVYPATNNLRYGSYWLREYKDGYGDAVTFDVVNDVDPTSGEALKANIPYIIALPGNNFNDDSMESMDLRFIATTDVLPKTTDPKVTGKSGDYAFQGNLNGNPVSGTAYKLVYGGDNQDYFEQTKDEMVDANLPFHAQIIATGETSTQAKLLYIKSSNDATGIVGTENEKPQEAQTYFTIDGANTGVTDAKLLKKGVYIHGNKKILIK